MPEQTRSGRRRGAPTKRLQATLRKQLEAERVELLGQAESLEADFTDQSWREPRSGEDAEGGSATFERERMMSLARAARDQVDQIDHALARMDAGTYGFCVGCDNPIPTARLEARPQAADCLDCRRTAERTR